MTPVMLVMIPVMIPVMPVMYSCYDHCVIYYECFHRIFGFMIICCSYPTLSLVSIPPVSCSYLIISWVLPVRYLLAYTCLCSRHGFQYMLMIRFYRYTWAYLCTPSGFCLTTRLGSFIWLPWILMSRSWSLERVDSPNCWSEWRSGSVDPQQIIQNSILPGPLVRL